MRARIQYTLKDNELLAQMRQLFFNFDEALDSACVIQMDDQSKYVCVYHLNRNSSLCDEIHFFKDEIKCLEGAFDPFTWNPFPEVTPPKKLWLRVETRNGLGFKASYSGDRWIDGNYCPIDEKDEEHKIFRFRLWSDDEIQA